MMHIITPERLGDGVRRRIAASRHLLNVYWMRVAENREAYAEALLAEVKGEPIVVLVIRDRRFTNPNALLDEFVELVDQSRGACEGCITDADGKCGFILLSRTEL